MTKKTAIAIIDDDPPALKAVGLLLSQCGYRVQLFTSGESFLSVAAKSEAKCLIVDVQLVDISGIELVRQLQDTGYRFPVIFITGSADSTFEAQARALDCVAYLRKPVHLDDLLGAIAKALGSDAVG